jgi:hypothetical protein
MYDKSKLIRWIPCIKDDIFDIVARGFSPEKHANLDYICPICRSKLTTGSSGVTSPGDFCGACGTRLYYPVFPD